MLSRPNRRRKFFLRQEGSQRQPRRQRLGNRHHVGGHPEILKRKNRSRPAQPALNLVKDQRRPVPVGQRPAFPEKLARALIDSAFAENRLQHDGAGVVIHRRPQAFDIVLLHESDIFKQRFESLAMLILPGQRQCAKRPPMIGTLERHQPAFRRPARAMSSQPRQLDRALDRLRPAVGEEHPRHSRRAAGKLAQLFRQPPLILVIVEIRNVQQLRRLLANRLHDPRMRVPQRIHAQSRNKVEIALALDVIHEHSLAARQHDRIAVISLQQKLLFPFCDFFKGSHKNSILPEGKVQADCRAEGKVTERYRNYQQSAGTEVYDSVD
ncbi:hypothetical protein SBA1_270036 [Candidatus Sulfotelmatobacter kueseliae]|uniref:Uncharacterized protein n=1 Tax=Candidatus Sulfotelmatobacter kueseliae TaxID=2042962 RepID=A0A2U3KI41_9BACT|nr:hypothetical protein SBA1_270036 [Candidatus Sulfotelmatobacter kueseliae]